MYSWKILCLLVVVSSGGGYRGNNSGSGSPVDTVPVVPVVSRALKSAKFTQLLENFDRRYEKFRTLEFFTRLTCSAFIDAMGRPNSTEGTWHQACSIIYEVGSRLGNIRFRLGLISRSMRKAFDILDTGISNIDYPMNQSAGPDILRITYRQISRDKEYVFSNSIEIVDVWLDSLYNITTDICKSQDATDTAEVEELDKILANRPMTSWGSWKSPDQRVVNTATEAKSRIISRRAARNDFTKVIFNLIDQVRNDCVTLLKECIKENQELTIPRFFAFAMKETDRSLNLSDSRNFTAEALPVAPVVSRTLTLANFTTLVTNVDRLDNKFVIVNNLFHKEQLYSLLDAEELLNLPRGIGRSTFESAMFDISWRLRESCSWLDHISRDVRTAYSILDASISNIDYPINQLVARYVLPIDYDATLSNMYLVTFYVTQILDVELSSVYNITIDRCKLQDAVDAADIEKQDQILANASSSGADQGVVNNATIEKSLRVSRRARRNNFLKMIVNFTNQLRNDYLTMRDECLKYKELIPEFYAFVMNKYDVGMYLNTYRSG